MTCFRPSVLGPGAYRYANLHTTAFVDQQLIPLPAVNGSATMLPIPPGQGGSLDVDVSFDLASLGASGSAGEFGVALRAPNNSLSAALTLFFGASAPDADGTRMVQVRSTQRLRPTVPSGPLPPLPVLKGERLTVRALIDRPYVTVLFFPFNSPASSFFSFLKARRATPCRLPSHFGGTGRFCHFCFPPFVSCTAVCHVWPGWVHSPCRADRHPCTVWWLPCGGLASYIEVFLQGGRIAFVISPAYDPSMTEVQLFNGFHCPPGTEPSPAGCLPPPPKPRCTYHKNMQLSDPGSKHTLAPVDAVDEAACCVQCMESAACFGAELYGESCYLKTAKLPLVKQIPPNGVALVACVKNQSAALYQADGERRRPPTDGGATKALVANVTVHGMGCGWVNELPKPKP